MSREYFSHEQELQRIHEILGVAIENCHDGVWPTIADLKEARELASNLLADYEQVEPF